MNIRLVLLLISDPNALKCYYCKENSEVHCNSFEYGEVVTCQTNNDEGPHFGDACSIGHEGTN